MNSPAAPTPSVADALIERIAATGTQRLYGLPGGGSSLDLIESARARGLSFVLARHEGAAVMMAATDADLSGGVGAALTTKGPGLANAMNGLAHASLDRSPVALIADGFSERQLSYVTHQWFDHQALSAPLVKGFARLAGGAVLHEIDRLIGAARAPRQGPVHLELTAGDARTRLSIDDATALQTAAPAPALSAPVESAALDQACDRLRRARKPLLVVGLEARERACSRRVRMLAEALGCPVLVTYKAKGVLADEHPSYVGIFTGGAAEQQAVAASDLILLIGADPVEFILQPWPYTLPVLELGRVEHPVHYVKADCRLLGDLGAHLDALVAAAQPGDWTTAHIAALRAEMRDALRYEGRGELVSPQQVVELAHAACAGNRDRSAARPRVSVDAGAHMFSATAFWPCAQPHDLLISNGLASMGYALPAAIAAALHEPERGAIAFTGDGGLMMCLGELATAVQARARIIVIVFNDGSLSLIDIKQQSRALPVAGVRWDRPDFASMMRGAGGLGLRARSPSAYRRALERALAAAGPVLIDVAVDPSGYPAQLRALRG